MIKCFESFFRMLFKSAQNSSLMSTLGPHQGSIQDCFAGRSTERCGPLLWTVTFRKLESMMMAYKQRKKNFVSPYANVYLVVLEGRLVARVSIE